MLRNALQLARQYPQQAEAILQLFKFNEDKQALRDLLGSCTCTSETLACNCPPVYSTPKALDHSGHLPSNT